MESAMRYTVATAILVALGLPTLATGPVRNEKAVPSPASKEFTGVVVNPKFQGNIIGLQLPTPKPPLATWELFRMALIPAMAIQWTEQWAEDQAIDCLWN